MLIDCDACVMRGPGCQDCVVTVVLGFAAEREDTLRIDDDERAALDVLAESGLVPPLRLVHAVDSVQPGTATDGTDQDKRPATGT